MLLPPSLAFKHKASIQRSSRLESGPGIRSVGRVDAHRRLNAAIGYLNLGMTEDAWGELQAIESTVQSRPEVLAVRIAILIRRQEWTEALQLSFELCQRLPEHPSPYLDAAFCLHELGRTVEARDFLMSGPAALQTNGTYHYNMACYEACLGNLHGSRNYLNRAIQIDESYRRLALTDPDLEALRQGQLPPS